MTNLTTHGHRDRPELAQTWSEAGRLRIAGTPGVPRRNRLGIPSTRGKAGQPRAPLRAGAHRGHGRSRPRHLEGKTAGRWSDPYPDSHGRGPGYWCLPPTSLSSRINSAHLPIPLVPGTSVPETQAAAVQGTWQRPGRRPLVGLHRRPAWMPCGQSLKTANTG